MSADDPIVGRAQASGTFPPGVSETIVLELHESGAVTWKPMPYTTNPYRPHP